VPPWNEAGQLYFPLYQDTLWTPYVHVYNELFRKLTFERSTVDIFADTKGEMFLIKNTTSNGNWLFRSFSFITEIMKFSFTTFKADCRIWE
jgi:hypothetical protein